MGYALSSRFNFGRSVLTGPNLEPVPGTWRFLSPEEAIPIFSIFQAFRFSLVQSERRH